MVDFIKDTSLCVCAFVEEAQARNAFVILDWFVIPRRRFCLKKKSQMLLRESIFPALSSSANYLFKNCVKTMLFIAVHFFVFGGAVVFFLAPGTAKNVCTEQLDTETNAWLDAAEVSGPS